MICGLLVKFCNFIVHYVDHTMKELRPNAKRGRIAVGMIWVIILLGVVSLIIESIQLLIASEIISVKDIGGNLLFILDSVLSYTTSLIFVATIASIVTFILWFRRAYYNIGLKTGKMRYGDGWAAGAWFIPILNLFVPYRIMKELYEKTDQYLVVNSREPYTERLKTDYVNGWWTLWIIRFFTSYISFKIEWGPLSTSDGNPFFSVLGSIIGITLGIVTIIVIEDYSKAERLLVETEDDAIDQ